MQQPPVWMGCWSELFEKTDWWCRLFSMCPSLRASTLCCRGLSRNRIHIVSLASYENFLFFFSDLDLNLIHQHVEALKTFKVTEWLVQSSNLWYWEPMSCAKVRVKGDGWGGGTGECAKLIYLLVEVSCITLTRSATSWTCSNLPHQRSCLHDSVSGEGGFLCSKLPTPPSIIYFQAWYGIIEHHYASSR